MNSFKYINDTYGLTLRRNIRCEYTGGKEPRLGTVVSVAGAHINIRFDDEPGKTVGPFHPTWELRYFEPAEA